MFSVKVLASLIILVGEQGQALDRLLARVRNRKSQQLRANAQAATGLIDHHIFEQCHAAA
jgi:hypothetical protein